MKTALNVLPRGMLWQPATAALKIAQLDVFQRTAINEPVTEQGPECFAPAGNGTPDSFSHMRPNEIDSNTPQNLFAAPISAHRTAFRSSLRGTQNSEPYNALLGYLERTLNQVAARTIIRGVFFMDTEITPQTLAWIDFKNSNRMLLRKLKIYIHSTSDAEAALQEILDLQTVKPIVPETLEIVAERDIKKARLIARRMSISIGFARLQETQLVTAVSELARNIFKYAGSGTINLSPLENQNGIAIAALDKGPGIPNLDEILGGSYKSKTGMGRGILGTKEMMTTFDIKSAKGVGTTITATMIKKSVRSR